MVLGLVAGSANPPLADAVAARLGVEPVPVELEHFPDGELQATVDASVSGTDVCIIQPTAPPGGRHLLELLLLADACHRAGCRRLTAIVPYFGYARQDRRTAPGAAVGAHVIADLLAAVRMDAVVVVDPHTVTLEAMLAMPAPIISAVDDLAAAIEPWLQADPVVVAPDLGATKLADRYANLLGLPLAVVRKTRISGAAVRSEVVVGTVRGKAPVIVDDMISTGGTIAAAAGAVTRAGAQGEVLVAATHGLFVGGATDLLAQLAIRRLFVTDTLACSEALAGRAEIISVAPLLAEAITSLHRG